MKQFFKFMFASMLGFILSLVLLFFLFAGIISLAVSTFGKDEVILKENSLLHISFNLPIQDRTSNNPFDQLNLNDFSSKKQLGLNDILLNIEKASKDDRIKGIFLDVSSLQSGMASIEEIRNKLIEFRKSGKYIYAYADAYSQGSYYLASASDKIYLNPQGAIMLNGLMAELMFFKGTLDKLEIEPQVIRHGKFKSAVEPFLLEKMSDENRKQIAGFIDPIWQHLVNNIALQRKLTPETVSMIADSLQARDSESALKLKLVDKLAYFDEFINDINIKNGQEKDKELNLVTLAKYNHVKDVLPSKALAKDKIAVIYATGSIGGGEGDDNSIGSDKISETIREARLDEKVKAIVLRVNSPGGSALASEVIWRETELARKVKPVVVSMGNVAASGGYYISCAADTIVAQPNTITGSIGVFGLLFNTQAMLKNKLGITTDIYKTGTYTDIGSPTRRMTDAERTLIQEEVDDIYEVFTNRVAAGRKITPEMVDSLGQGRVWSGTDAKRLGLVDVLGGLDDAVRIAASMAKTTDYRIRNLPEQKQPFQSLMEGFSTKVQTWYMQNSLGENFRYYKAAQDISKLNGIQMRTFYELELN